MAGLRSLLRYVLLFLTFLCLALAASPTSFCKCTCFTNSTLIPLDAPASSTNPISSSSKLSLRDILSTNTTEDRVAGRTCADCNKKFCLSYNLPICEKATEDDVFTTCFQRDSMKDQLIVWGFLIATVGLLGWAGLKPYIEKWKQGYRPLQGRSQGQQDGQ